MIILLNKYFKKINFFFIFVIISINGSNQNIFLKKDDKHSKVKKIFFSSLIFGSFFFGKKIEKKFLSLDKKKFSKFSFVKFLLPIYIEYKTKIFCSFFYKTFYYFFKRNKKDINYFANDESSENDEFKTVRGSDESSEDDEFKTTKGGCFDNQYQNEAFEEIDKEKSHKIIHNIIKESIYNFLDIFCYIFNIEFDKYNNELILNTLATLITNVKYSNAKIEIFLENEKYLNTAQSLICDFFKITILKLELDKENTLQLLKSFNPLIKKYYYEENVKINLLKDEINELKKSFFELLKKSSIEKKQGFFSKSKNELLELQPDDFTFIDNFFNFILSIDENQKNLSLDENKLVIELIIYLISFFNRNFDLDFKCDEKECTSFLEAVMQENFEWDNLSVEFQSKIIDLLKKIFKKIGKKIEKKTENFLAKEEKFTMKIKRLCFLIGPLDFYSWGLKLLDQNKIAFIIKIPKLLIKGKKIFDCLNELSELSEIM